MSIPSRREIQTRLLTLVGAAAFSLVASGVYAQLKLRTLDQTSTHSPSSESDLAAPLWEDVNLTTGLAPVPEDEVAMARSGILSDFEAR